MSYTGKILLSITLFICAAYPIYSQHQDINEKPNIWQGKKTLSVDTISLLNAFKAGNVEGHFRYFYSHTDNNEGLSDYFANAVGGGLRYESGKFKGFQVGVSGFYIFNKGSSDFQKKDEVTNQFNRYEIGLFDIEDPTNKGDLDRLEELYIKYNFGKSFIKFGRQLINTPFLNLQDGRMRPSGVEGVWAELNEFKKLHLEGGWLYAMSPRSTVHWYSAGNSVGIYPMGVTSEGNRSNYHGNIASEGVFLLGAQYQLNKWINVKLWDVLFENVNNTNLLQADFKYPMNKFNTLIGGIQFIHQQTVGNGGNKDPNLTYADKNTTATILGSQIGLKRGQLEITANYTHIFDQGRYLMPREWGRDPFYTFMPRERNEGFGDLDAYVGKISYNIPKNRIKISSGLGYFRLPDVKNFTLNKYGMPSYLQFNLDLRYSFSGMFKGLDTQFLVVSKINQGNLYDDRRFEINKVNLMLYNFVVNYHF
jgi:outer membrane porin, OprD family